VRLAADAFAEAARSCARFSLNAQSLATQRSSLSRHQPVNCAFDDLARPNDGEPVQFTKRSKDRNFVAALLETRLVDAGVIIERLLSVEERCRPDADRAMAWLES
jgi:hypothetical protein